MLKCKNCEKYQPFANDRHGVCSLPESFFPTMEDTNCVYLQEEMLTCCDCARFENDPACMWQKPMDKTCCGFLDKGEDALTEIMTRWLVHGTYSRKRIQKLMDEFEETDEFKFVQEHRAHEN